MPRLVDWVDQAIQYLHTVDEHGKPFGRGHLRASAAILTWRLNAGPGERRFELTA